MFENKRVDDRIRLKCYSSWNDTVPFSFWMAVSGWQHWVSTHIGRLQGTCKPPYDYHLKQEKSTHCFEAIMDLSQCFHLIPCIFIMAGSPLQRERILQTQCLFVHSFLFLEFPSIPFITLLQSPPHLIPSKPKQCRLCFPGISNEDQWFPFPFFWFSLLSFCCTQPLSCVRLFATSWTVAHQSPLSLEFSRQEYWSRLFFLLQGSFPTQRSNPLSLVVSCISKRILYH